VKGVVRRYAVRLLAEEKIHGYLAFDGDTSIAWCNAGNMDDYVSWIPDAARRNACGKTLSMVCFAIAPEYRGKGMGSQCLSKLTLKLLESSDRVCMLSNMRFEHAHRSFQKAGYKVTGKCTTLFL
jgi:GNAT superfamily N-acetyltransferase